MHLYIGNKVYSSWSLRPWLAMRAFGVPFEETLIPFTDPAFKEKAQALSGAGLVPVLKDGAVTVWESLAIIEYVADRFPEKQVWPEDPAARAHARAMSAEMHAGFSGLRAHCPMNLGKRYAARDRGPEVDRDVARVEYLVNEAREKFGEPAGGSFLYGAFSAADAMYAPLMTRLDTYGIALSDTVRTYVDAVLATEAFQAWLSAALKETWVFPEDEVDEPEIENFRAPLASS